MADLNYTSTADISQILAAIQKLEGSIAKLGMTFSSIIGNIQSVTSALDEQGDVITTVKSKMSEVQSSTIKLDSAGKLLTATVKNTTAAYERQQAALAAVAAQQANVNAQANRVVKSVTMGVGNQTAFKAVNANPLEIQSYQVAVANMKELLVQHEITATRGKQMWQQMQSGAISYASVGEAKVGTAMRNIVIAQDKLGASAKANSAQAVQGLNTVKAATDKANEASKGFLLSWHSFGRLLTIQLMHQAISQLSQAIQQGTADAIEYQIRISEIRTISQDSALSSAEWAKGIRDVSDSFGLDILDTAESAYQAISNQVVKGAKSFDFMREAAKLAVTTVSSTANAVNTLSAVINSYGLQSSDAAKISAQLFTAVNLGKFRLDQIAESLGNITILGREAGVSFEELMAAMAATTRQGLSVSQSMTQLRGFISQVLKPSVDMGKFLKSIGAESGEAAFKMFGLIGVADKLRNSTNGTSTEIGEMVRNMRGLLEVLALSGSAHSAYIESLDRITNSTTEYATATAIAMESTARTVKLEANKVRNYFLNEMGQGVIDGLAKASIALGGFENVVKNTFKGIKIALEVGTIALMTQFRKVQVLLRALSALILAHPILAGITAAGTAAVVTTELIARMYAKIAEREEKEYKRFYEIFNERKALLAAARTQEETKVNSLLQEASGILVGKVAAQIAKMESVITATIANSKAIAKILDEAFDAVGRKMTEEISQIQSLIKETEQQVKGVDKFLKDFKASFSKMHDDLAKQDLEGNPAGQIDYYSEKLTELAKKLKQATSLEDSKRIAELMKDNVQEQVKIEHDAAKTNIKNADKRLEIEKAITKENKAYDNQSRKLNFQVQQLEKNKYRNADKLNQRAIDRETLDQNHKDTLDKLNKEYVEYKAIVLKKRDLNKLETGVTTFTEKEIKHTGKFQEEVAKALAESSTKLADAKTLLGDLKLELDRLDLSKILDETDSSKLKQWFTERTELITEATEIFAKQSAKLPELEKEKITAAIKQMVDEKAAIKLRLESIPVAKTEVADVEAKQAQVADSLKIAEGAKGKIDDVIARINSRLQKGIESVILQMREAGGGEGPYATDVLPVLEGLKKIPTVGDIKKLPEDIQRRIAEESGGSATYAQLQTLMKQQEAASNQVKRITEYATSLADKYKTLSQELPKAAETKLPDLTKAFTIVGDSLSTFSDSLIKLSQFIDKEIAPAPVAVVPGKALGGPVQRFANGGMAGTDTIPAMLTPGEFVMNAASTRRFYSQLVAMNSGGRYSGGGHVGNTTTVGDINVSLRSSGNETVDVVKIGRLLQREIKRGTICLS